MAEFKQRLTWDHTAVLASTILNCRQGLKQNQLIKDPTKLNPFGRQKKSKRSKNKVSMAVFSNAFGD